MTTTAGTKPRSPGAAGEGSGDDAIGTPIGESNLGWSVFKSTAAQILGRGLVALGRLVIAGIIVRAFGKGTFAEYSLVFVILSLGEWLVDFGTSEIMVREVCREPGRGKRYLRILTAARLVQVPLAILLVAGILLAMRYPMHVVAAGLIGALSLVGFGGALIYRVVFRSTLTVERDVAAEILSVVLMVPLIGLVAFLGGGLHLLVACHVVSRIGFFFFSRRFGRGQFLPSIEGVTRAELAEVLRPAIPIGLIGFLVAVYEASDMLILSKLADLSDLAFYSGAQRLSWPLLMALGAIGATLYPVAASYWPHDRASFGRACQRGLDTVVLLAGLGASVAASGAAFLMGLLGPELVEGAPAFTLFALLIFIKSIGATTGPILYVLHAQRQALIFISIALVARLVVTGYLAPRQGYFGVILGALAVELCLATLPSVVLVQRISGYRWKWSIVARVALIALSVTLVSRALLGQGILSAMLAGSLYIVLVILTRAFKPAELRSLLRWRES